MKENIKYTCMKKTKAFISAFLIAALAVSCCSCKKQITESSGSVETEAESAIMETETSGVTETTERSEPETETAETAKKSNDIVILATSDIHCCPQKGFGFAGLYRIREKYQKEGCEVLLVDDGDEFEGHGEMFGPVTQGEQVLNLMNKMGYDAAIPGNHDFNYGPEKLIALSKKANYPYISCNIAKNGKLIFKPYIIKEVNGKKIAFVGATTPRTIGDYTSETVFQDSDGKTIYGMHGGNKGKNICNTIQASVNAARAEGADYVFAMTHIGQAKKYKSYDNITFVMSNTKGIDAFLDGHSHDAKKLEAINSEGKPVTRIAMGARFTRIGYVRISGEDGSIKTGIFTWSSGAVSAAELFGIRNEMSEEVDKEMSEFNDTYNKTRATLTFPLLITDPNKADSNGNPIRNVTKVETNMGDFVADAFRWSTGADIAIVTGNMIKASLQPGDISMKDCYNVLPATKQICVVKATGQDILDALEWSCRKYPNENGAFLQVSGITFKVNTKIKSTAKSKKGKFYKVTGERRVSNVKIGGEPIDKKKTYTVASYLRTLRRGDDGYKMFKECKRTKIASRLDFQILSDYIDNKLKGNIASSYKNPSGQKRITTA